MRFIFVLLTLTTLVLPAHAQLGETVEQCATLYGKPLSIDGPPGSPTTAYHFTFKDYSIVIYFVQDKSPSADSQPAPAPQPLPPPPDKPNPTYDKMRALVEETEKELAPQTKASKIIVRRLDNKVLSDQEIRALLVANAEQQQWTPAIPGWQRTDQAVAFGLDADSNHVDSAPVALMMEESDYEGKAVASVFTTITPYLEMRTNSPPTNNQ